MADRLTFSEFDYLAVFHVGSVDGEADDRPDLVPSLFAGGARVHVKAS